MISKTSPISLLIALLVLSPVAWPQADFALQPSPPLSSAGVPAALADLLQEQGSRLVVRTAGGANDPICDLWWVKSIHARRPAAPASGVLYGELETGALVGLLHFMSSDAEDSHDQKLKHGFYVMRYARFPPENKDVGDSQYQDFLLLTPMAAESQFTKALSFDDLVRLSAMATGTGHPALMALVPANPAYKRLPAVVADDVGNCAVQVILREESQAGSRAVVMSLLLITPPKEDGAS